MNMKMNFSMDEIRLKVEEYIKKGSRAAGRPVLTAYYVRLLILLQRVKGQIS